MQFFNWRGKGMVLHNNKVPSRTLPSPVHRYLFSKIVGEVCCCESVSSSVGRVAALRLLWQGSVSFFPTSATHPSPLATALGSEEEPGQVLYGIRWLRPEGQTAPVQCLPRRHCPDSAAQECYSPRKAFLSKLWEEGA